MTRYIDADAVNIYTTSETIRHIITDLLDAQPTVDAVPVRHGTWRFVNCATGLRCQCSECLHWVDAGTDKNYCPNCGARMVEE